MRVDLMGGSSRVLCLTLGGRISRLVHRRVSLDGSLHQLIRLADAVSHLAFDQLLAVEAVHRNLGIGCDDNAVRVLDLLVGKHIFRSAGASCLHLDKTPCGFRSLLQPFRRHVRVRDPGRTGCDCQDPALILYRSILCLGGKLIVHVRLFLIRMVHDLKKFVHCLRILQILCKFFIHEQHGQLAQHVEMDVVFRVRRGDQKDQMDRLSVQRVKVHSIWNDHGCKSRFYDCVALAVRDGDPFPDSRCSFFLSPVDFLSVSFLVPDLPAFYHKRYHLVEGVFLRRRSAVEQNTSSVKQFCDLHIHFLPFIPVLQCFIKPADLFLRRKQFGESAGAAR